jgi:diaminopimelate dehydrogenase
VDSFDTHAKIPEYLEQVNSAAKTTTAIISTGWDPGLFSMQRLMSEAVLPDGCSYTFWGSGVSQGHSAAIRSVNGVKDAVQYTIPIDSALDAVRRGERPDFTARQKHLRQCYVVTETGANKSEIEETIKKMPNYFDEYDTTVNFISEEELKVNHSEMPHGGFVLHSGNTGGNKHVIEYSLKLSSNPEFTGSIMAAYARAAYRLSHEGQFGAKTVFDVPLTYISPKSRSELIRELL